MHTLVRRYIKTAVFYLMVGLVIGGVMIVRRELYGSFPHPYLVSAHTHAILVGFVMMMILGVALWLFPRPDREDTRYSPRAAQGAYWTLTLATAARVAGEVARAIQNAPRTERSWVQWVIVAAGLGQVAAIGLFFFTMWSRIRPVGSHVREAKGERF
ncbi:MAG TPA: cbb3-type cytochrome c oxidase subunit I [Gemmatimonadaceae bacterium]|nr:cbb3-type cytochrome c oxidase subunit I [Gemmatimonadaceae bacterium]